MKSIFKILVIGAAVIAVSAKIPVTQPVNTDTRVQKHDFARFVELHQREKRVRQVLSSVKTNLTKREKEDLARIIAKESMDSGFTVEFVMAVMKTESSFNKLARSPVGAVGLMQLMPATGKAIARDYGIVLKNNDALYNPELNVTLGIRYLKKLADRFKDMNLVLAAYNMGPTKFRTYRQDNGYPVFKYTKLVRKAHATIDQL
ncbi:MAG: lytic transglycosylase domain-containing protein [Acidobacteria bacterium]|nr:lytic transglycosylase domain-containing protein [Acidobacteriota bacterium]